MYFQISHSLLAKKEKTFSLRSYQRVSRAPAPEFLNMNFNIFDFRIFCRSAKFELEQKFQLRVWQRNVSQQPARS